MANSPSLYPNENLLKFILMKEFPLCMFTFFFKKSLVTNELLQYNVCSLTIFNLDKKNFLKILRHKNLFFQADLDNLINYYLFFFAIHPHIETSGLFVFVLPPCG